MADGEQRVLQGGVGKEEAEKADLNLRTGPLWRGGAGPRPVLGAE